LGQAQRGPTVWRLRFRQAFGVRCWAALRLAQPAEWRCAHARLRPVLPM